MCKESNGCSCMCHKFFGIIRLVIAGIFIGAAAGMTLMYFFDHDRWLQFKAKKMFKNAQDLTNNIKSKMNGENN